jgi:hypothetical protein
LLRIRDQPFTPGSAASIRHTSLNSEWGERSEEHLKTVQALEFAAPELQTACEPLQSGGLAGVLTVGNGVHLDLEEAVISARRRLKEVHEALRAGLDVPERTRDLQR